MKEIIKHGSAVRKFKCKNCECKFIATYDEIDLMHSDNTHMWINNTTKESKITWDWISFQTSCPECGNICTITLKGEDVLNDHNNRTRKSKRSS